MLRQLLGGMISVLSISPISLYRFPYRNSAEALRGDCLRVGKDISFAIEKLEDEASEHEA
jgi:hypothetical protein